MEKREEIKDNEWVFNCKTSGDEEGIDLDIDKVEQTMKPEAGARYIGDVRDQGFVPVGFRSFDSTQKVKSRVEFKNPGVYKKTVKKIAQAENWFFKLLKKIKF